MNTFARPRFALLAAALLPILLCLPATAETVMKDGVPHVMNDATPRDGVQELQLEERWRRGGEDDEEVLLGLVTSVLADPEGNLYVLDAQLSEVKVFSADGELTGTLGRQGEGPGEFQGAQRITFAPDDRIGVIQAFPGKLIMLNKDGTPGGEVLLGAGDPTQGNMAFMIDARYGGDNLVAMGLKIEFDQESSILNRHMFVRSCAADGASLHEYCGKEIVWNMATGVTVDEDENDFVWWRLGVDNTGRVIIAEPRTEYLISVYAPDGTLERVFGREYESWTRTEPIKARFAAMIDAQTRQLPPDTAKKVSDLEQDIWGVHCHRDGTYWVTTSRGMYVPPEGALTTWDVFSSEGEYLRQVTANVPGNPGVDLTLLTDADQLVVVRGFWDAVLSVMGGEQDGEAEPMEIVCYGIK